MRVNFAQCTHTDAYRRIMQTIHTILLRHYGNHEITSCTVVILSGIASLITDHQLHTQSASHTISCSHNQLQTQLPTHTTCCSHNQPPLLSCESHKTLHAYVIQMMLFIEQPTFRNKLLSVRTRHSVIAERIPAYPHTLCARFLMS